MPSESHKIAQESRPRQNTCPKNASSGGHDLRVLGRTDEAIAQFRKADALELAYYESEKIPAQYDWHRIHNLQAALAP